MSIWVKLGVAELLFAVFIGVLLGQRAGIDVTDKKREPMENDVAFTVGVIALAAKMAKADGVVTKDEVKAFKTAFKVSDAEMKQGARVFNLAKQNVAGYEDCAEQLVIVFKATARYSKTCSKACSTSPRRTRHCIPTKKSSSARSPSVSALPISNSTRSGPATSLPASAIHTKCWA